MKEVALLLGLVVIVILAQQRTVWAHDFLAPEVEVFVSHREPGGHPDLQTVVMLDRGATFERVRVVAPPGSTIAADADIPDGTIVGRLDGMATTNAITLPECNVPVSFSVDLREATTDLDSPAYPAYLKELAPGQHRLRYVADVTPAPDVPILINYLLAIDEESGSVVSHIIIGNPLDPPARFKTCTPMKSVVTLVGVTPDGMPLLTNPDPVAEGPQLFKYTFISRPDADGHRHEETVEALTKVASLDEEAPPSTPSRIDNGGSAPVPDVGVQEGVTPPSTGQGAVEDSPASVGEITIALAAAALAALGAGALTRSRP